MNKVLVELPPYLHRLASAPHVVELALDGAPTFNALIDALEARYPALGGTIRDYATGERRPFLRFFAAQQDWSHLPLSALLPATVIVGTEPLLIVGAIAGG